MLLTEQDFYDLMYEYLRKASIDNVFVAEIFFDPQTHTDRGVSFDVVINGLHRALVDGYRDFSIKGSLIMCFLRHLSEDAAIATLEQAKPHLNKIIGVGLDSGEIGNPPSKFEHVYKMAAECGLKLVAHAGEEGGPEYITEALDLLHVKRIDHGVQCLKDPKVVKRLVREGIPLTTCPLSNSKLQVYSRYFGGKNITRDLLEAGLKVTINSDDPAYFGGYITDNFKVTAKEVGLSEIEVCEICRNAFRATFLPETEKQFFLKKIDHFNVAMGCAPPPKSVTFFGSRSPRPESDVYKQCALAAEKLASRGFQIVNGGYGGLMEAASRGARQGMQGATGEGGGVVGVLAPRVFSGRHAAGNEFLTQRINARSIHERVEHLIDSSEYFFISGGTIGTITELMMTWFLSSVRPLSGGVRKRLYLLEDPWRGVMEGVMTGLGVYEEDRGLLTYVKDVDEMVRLVEEDWETRNKVATITN